MSGRRDHGREALARRVQQGLIEELGRAWEEAAIQGLCGEGALEYALDRLRHADPLALAERAAAEDGTTPGGTER